MRKAEQIVMDILQSKEDLADLCEYLDSCYDLYDLGYINSKVEQDILIQMSETSALTLWAIHKYANEGCHVNYEYPFKEFVKELKVDEQALRRNEVEALTFFRQFDTWEDCLFHINHVEQGEEPILDTFFEMPDSMISACYFYATGFDESFKQIFNEYIERVDL